MRVPALKAAIFVTTALVSAAALAHPAVAAAKPVCPCDCPDDHKVAHKSAVAVPHRFVRRVARPAMREGYYYNYAEAGPVIMRGWHGAWRAAPNDGQVPMMGPVYRQQAQAAYYGPPPAYGVPIDDRGFTGGVGYGGEGGGGGGGGGFADGFGQVHLAQGGGTQNGPTYNDYNQSFQSNASVAGPFQPRLMGGLAPATSSSSK